MHTVLFDLDGTLLPMEMEAFGKTYFRGLCSAVPELPAQSVITGLNAGIRAMMKNTGEHTNREVFAEAFTQAGGIPFYEYEPRFTAYYRAGFQECKRHCKTPSISKKMLEILKEKGYTVAIATNPLFPRVATWSRLRWLGIDPESLPLVTTYEDSVHAKPNPAYFQDVCNALRVKAEDCLMVGNDAEEDGAAKLLGMEVYLVTDCLLNRKEIPLDGFKTGSLQELYRYLEALPKL